MIGVSMPVFWIGALMSYYLGFKAGIFPNGGYVEFFDGPTDWVYHLILPGPRCRSCSSGSSPPARSSVLDVHGTMCAPRAGVSERQVLLRHVLRNSMIPIVTLWGSTRSGPGRRGDPHGDVRPQGVGQYARVRPPARRASGADDHDVRRLPDRRAEHRGGHPLCGSRPEDPAPVNDEPLLAVNDLAVSFETEGPCPGRRRRSFEAGQGEILAVVGVWRREVRHGDDADGPDSRPNALRGLGPPRGTELRRPPMTTRCGPFAARRSAMIFQDPMTSLNPVIKIETRSTSRSGASRHLKPAGAGADDRAARARRHTARATG